MKTARLIGSTVVAGLLLAILCIGVYFLLGYKIAIGLWFILMFTNLLSTRGIINSNIK